MRLELTLHRPGAPWPGIDPEATIRAGAHRSEPLESLLGAFLAERTSSLEWLATLDAPDWNARSTARGGALRAGDLLASWLRHDLLHLRQLLRLEKAWLEVQLPAYSGDYAGPW